MLAGVPDLGVDVLHVLLGVRGGGIAWLRRVQRVVSVQGHHHEGAVGEKTTRIRGRTRQIGGGALERQRERCQGDVRRRVLRARSSSAVAPLKGRRTVVKKARCVCVGGCGVGWVGLRV